MNGFTIKFWLCCVCVLLGSIRVSHAAEFVFPQGTVALARPEILWRVAAPRGKLLKQSEMTLDGQKVASVYRSLRHALTYQPDYALDAGFHSVTCRVQFDDGTAKRCSWTFRVADDALLFLPTPNATQRMLFQEANAYRRIMGLPDFVLNTALCATAQAHSEYAALNEGEGHGETDGKPGFRGRTPSERARAMGYTAGASEDISWSNSNDAIAQLIAAPYHRLPFMEPGSPDFGSGSQPLTPVMAAYGRNAQRTVTTLNFRGKGGQGIVVYPVPDQTDVPLTFDGGETPNPLRLHEGAGSKSGYIITLTVFGANGNLRFVRATLTDMDGAEVPVWINAPHNDSHLKNAVFVVPRKPLTLAMTYKISIVYAIGEGQENERMWSFSTQEKAGQGRRLAQIEPLSNSKRLLPDLGKTQASKSLEHSPEEAELLAQINQFRRRLDNLPALKADSALMAAAQRHTRDMAENHILGHRGFDLSEVADRVRDAGYVAEVTTQQIVIGKKYVSPEKVLDSLIPLPLNRRSLLDARWTECGISHRTFANAQGDTVHAWVMVFARPRSKEGKAQNSGE